MTKKNHLQDPHVLGRHLTTAECASEVIKVLRHYDPALDIKPGFIKPKAKHGGPIDLKIWELEYGLKIRVSGHGCVQPIFALGVHEHQRREVLVGVLIEHFGWDNVQWHTIETVRLRELIRLASLDYSQA